MTYCRICIDDIKKPVSLPCGHIFCSECIVKTLQNVKPQTALHPCPICRSVYNIAPINLHNVPQNLRPFLTPSIRRVYLDDQTTEQKDTQDPASPPSNSTLSAEVQRLRAENEALRSNCVMWRKRAETHGTANLGLINFAKTVRDQATILARDRDNLQARCRLLSRKLEDIEMAKYVETGLMEPLFDADSEHSKRPDPTSLLFAPPFRFPSEPTVSEKTHVKRAREESTPAGGASVTPTSTRPQKRIKTEPTSPTPLTRSLSATLVTPPLLAVSPAVSA